MVFSEFLVSPFEGTKKHQTDESYRKSEKLKA